ncbi:unnamed protein product, partial [Didymodactylos carnosus]
FRCMFRIRNENNKVTSQQNDCDKYRAVIVRFYSRSIRQLVLASLDKLRGKNLGVTVVEDLTKNALEVYCRERAKLEGNEKKKVLARNGRVYVRQHDNNLTLISE